MVGDHLRNALDAVEEGRHHTAVDDLEAHHTVMEVHLIEAHHRLAVHMMADAGWEEGDMTVDRMEVENLVEGDMYVGVGLEEHHKYFVNDLEARHMYFAADLEVHRKHCVIDLEEIHMSVAEVVSCKNAVAGLIGHVMVYYEMVWIGYGSMILVGMMKGEQSQNMKSGSKSNNHIGFLLKSHGGHQALHLNFP